jgi:hypothetical protein
LAEASLSPLALIAFAMWDRAVSISAALGSRENASR